MTSLRSLKYLYSASKTAFFLLGFGYILAYFLKTNSLYILPCEYYFRLADSPFFLSAIFYFFLAMRIKSEKVHQLTCLDPHEHKDFFLEEALYIFLGTLAFFTYFAIDLLQ